MAAETFIIWAFNTIYNPFVVTNAEDKRFNPKRFQFHHYSRMVRNEGEFNPAMLKMFPPGTDKAYVDQILVKQAGARAPSPNELMSTYHNPGDSDYTYIWGEWLVRFIFDKSNKTTMMTVGKEPFYGIDPIDTFWKGKRPS